MTRPRVSRDLKALSRVVNRLQLIPEGHALPDGTSTGRATRWLRFGCHVRQRDSQPEPLAMSRNVSSSRAMG